MFKKLQRMSSTLFAVSALSGQTGFFLNGLAGTTVKIFTLMLNLTAYGFWATASVLLPQEANKKSTGLSGFTFKWQSLAAALAGLAATLFYITALLQPLFTLPATWCVALCNIFWLGSEVDRYHHQAAWLEPYNEDKQRVHIQYTTVITASSVVSALLLSLSLFFPGSHTFILSAVAVSSMLFSVSAAQYWILRHSIPSSESPQPKPESATISEVPSSLYRLTVKPGDRRHHPLASAAKRIPCNTKSASMLSNIPLSSKSVAKPPVATISAGL